MTRAAFHNSMFILIGLSVMGLIFWAFYLSTKTSQSLLDAQRYYEAAGNAPNVIQRITNLNQALRTYVSLEDQYNPVFGNGKLYDNIGLVYFDLQQYSWAALYFYQAIALRPRDQRIQENLQRTLKELHINEVPRSSIFKKVFFFHDYLSLSERLQILFGSTILILSLASLYIWKHYRFLKGMIAALLLLWIVFFCSVIFTKYFEPLEAVLIIDSMLYRDAEVNSALVVSKPIFGGHKVEVLDVLDHGAWLKVRTDTGLLGFVPSDSVRLIK